MPPITSLLLAGAVVLTGGAVATAPPASFSRFAAAVSRLQESMISDAKAADPAAVWTVDCHSRGKAVILEEGDVWEKGCISVTQIDEGELSAVRAATISGRTGARIEAGARYSACALSFVLHARSPLVPTLRGDARVFVVGEREWYGGGLDLTPSYVEEEDCAYFHASLAELCGRHGPEGTYEAMKAWPRRGRPRFARSPSRAAAADAPVISFSQRAGRLVSRTCSPPPSTRRVRTCRSWRGGARSRTPRPRRRGSCCAAAATSSSTCSMTAASGY